jgi:hypothetical protein
MIDPLPNELLMMVVSYMITLHVLSLTSKFLNFAAQPALYSHCDLDLTLNRCTKLALTIVRRPELGKLCQSLSFMTKLNIGWAAVKNGD